MTLSEYALARIENNAIVAAETEEQIYNALGLDWIPPELRENCGEIEAAAKHALPKLIEREDIKGDLHMHTHETDGTCSIREMAEAAMARGLRYIAITDHSKNLSMTNGMDDRRAIEHVRRIREVDRELREEVGDRIRVLPGIEVDILADGSLDLADETLAEMDVVVASVHSRFDMPMAEMTARVIRALENPHVSILGHATGRKLLRRDPYALDVEAVLKRAVELGVAVEHNASPARADLNDTYLRRAKELGCKIVVDTDAHATEELDQLRWGVTQLRRAWLEAGDVLNTEPDVTSFLTRLRRRS